MIVSGRLLQEALARARANVELGDWPDDAVPVAEASFEDRLHPRDRRGRWADVLRGLASPGRADERPSAKVQVDALRDRWASLDRELLPYAGRPHEPEAKDIIRKQQIITKLIHHRDLDEGATSGFGQPGGPLDVLVIGAGPAGLSAAVYGATEGMDMKLIDPSDKPGGQAGLSTRIENLIGFPAGVAGDEFARMALEQAERVGADCEFGVSATGIEAGDDGMKTVHLSDGRDIQARSVVLAGGVQFRKLEVPGSDGPGVFYGDARSMIASCGDRPAVIVGGANSAGQAAVQAASELPHVTVIVRGKIDGAMSSYLISQLRGDPKVTIIEGAEVQEVRRDAAGNPEAVVLKDGREVPAAGMGLFIGSSPEARWAGVETDARGYVETGGEGRGSMETNVPGVFAAGDLRAGNKQHRVATAVGEGAVAISEAFAAARAVGQEATVAEAAGPKDDPETARPGEWSQLEAEAAATPDDAADAFYALMLGLDEESPLTDVEAVPEGAG